MNIFYILLFFTTLSFNLLADSKEELWKERIELINKELGFNPKPLGNRFEKHYDYYFKYCTMSRYTPKKTWEGPGSGSGHSGFFLKGACLDKNRGPAGLKLCPKGDNYDSSDTGVGLSVNIRLKNANFFVFPTLKRFFGTEVDNNKEFNWELKNNIISDLVKSNIFKGYDYHYGSFPDLLLDEHREEYMARDAFGTDYAVSIARSLYCVSIPMNRGVMETVIYHLNDLNDSYSTSKDKDYRGGVKDNDDFEWHYLYDNCAHTPINALASVGIIKRKKINTNLLSQTCNLAIPGPTFTKLHKAINQKQHSIDYYYNNKTLKEMILKHKWFPQMHTGFIEYIPMHSNNTYYDSDETVWFLNKKKLKKITSDPRYAYHGGGERGLLANFLFSYERLKKQLKDIEVLKTQSKYKDAIKSVRSAETTLIKASLKYLDRIIKNKEISSDEENNIKKQIKKYNSKLKKINESEKYINFIKNFRELIKNQTLKIEGKIEKIIGLN